MSWIAVGTLAVTAATSAYSGYKASQGPDNPEDVFGKKPQIAPFLPLDLAAEQKKAATSNLANIDSVMALLERLAPGFSDRIAHGLKTSDEWMHGILPQDVQDQLMRANAESTAAGIGGFGQMADFKDLRNLGLTSLEGMRIGENSAQLWTRMATGAAEPYLITTKEQVAAAAANQAGQQATQQFAFNVAAQPNPAAAGQYNLDLLSNQATQQSINQFTSALGTFAKNYNTNAVTPAGGITPGGYQYNPATGVYEYVSGG